MIKEVFLKIKDLLEKKEILIESLKYIDCSILCLDFSNFNTDYTFCHYLFNEEDKKFFKKYLEGRLFMIRKELKELGYFD